MLLSETFQFSKVSSMVVAGSTLIDFQVIHSSLFDPSFALTDVERSSFACSSLSGAMAKAVNTDFSDSLFSDTRFGSMVFENVSFSGCCFLGASFFGCTFKQVQFEGCDMRGVTFTRCSFDNKCTFEDTSMEGVSFLECITPYAKGPTFKESCTNAGMVWHRSIELFVSIKADATFRGFSNFPGDFGELRKALKAQTDWAKLLSRPTLKEWVQKMNIRAADPSTVDTAEGASSESYSATVEHYLRHDDKAVVAGSSCFTGRPE